MEVQWMELDVEMISKTDTSKSGVGVFNILDNQFTMI